MSVHPNRQRFHARKQAEGSERVQTRSCISQERASHVENVGLVAEFLPELHPVVSRRRFRQMQKSSRVDVPGEFPAVNNGACDGVS